MREIAVIGVGQTKVDEHWGISIRELAVEAILSAVKDSGQEVKIDGIFVGNMLSPIISGQSHLGALIADWSGLNPSESTKFETACSSGAAAFRSALIAIASGEIETALAVGVEKMTDKTGHDVTAALATAADADYESEQGISFVGLNALIMRRYMHEFGWKHEDFAPFSINAHTNAVHNPYARLQNQITLDVYMNSPMVASPINLMDASPIGDGAAAALLVPAERLKKDLNIKTGKRAKITVAASASSTDTVAIHSRKQQLFLSAAHSSSKKAYAQSAIKYNDIDLFEVHDAFSIMCALSLEACGFCEIGQAPRLGLDNDIAPGGRLPICTRGGLKARGHPVGATGMYQIVEIVQQLRGDCGPTQVEGAICGMAQSIGGSGTTILTHILKSN